MERIDCPVCGYRTLVTLGRDVWGALNEVLLEHSVPGEGWVACVANRLHPEDAAAVGRIREQGGERLRPTAHP